MLGDEEPSIREGVLIPWTTQGKGLFQYYERLLEGLAADLNFSLDTPWKDLRVDVQEAVLRGENYKVTVKWKNRYGREMRYSSGFEGVVPYIERQYVQAESDTQRQRWSEYLREVPCAVCNGDRLKPEVLAVLVHGHSIADASRLSLGDAQEYFAQLELHRPRGEDRRAGAARDPRAAGLPAAGRPQLPQPVAIGRIALGRRGAAHPARDADRIGTHRRALRARRALDRPASARQPAAHRDAAHPARPRQHAHRRRARRGDDPRRRLGRRHRPRRRRQRRRGRALRPVRSSCSPRRSRSPATTSPGGARSRRRRSGAASTRSARSSSRARARTTSAT